MNYASKKLPEYHSGQLIICFVSLSIFFNFYIFFQFLPIFADFYQFLPIFVTLCNKKKSADHCGDQSKTLRNVVAIKTSEKHPFKGKKGSYSGQNDTFPLNLLSSVKGTTCTTWICAIRALKSPVLKWAKSAQTRWKIDIFVFK